MKLTIPIPRRATVNTFYSAPHWAVRAKLASEYHEAVFWAVKRQKVRLITKYPVVCHYLFKLKGRLPDVSNLLVKLIEDGLVKAGVLKGDSPEYVSKISLEVEKGNDEVAVEILTP